jgi:hypothetical protein
MIVVGAILLLSSPFGISLGIGISMLIPIAALALIVLGIVQLSGGGHGITMRLWGRLPTALRNLMRAYLWVLGAALATVALLFVVNVFVPLGPGIVRGAAGTFFSITLGWAWGMLGAVAMAWRPLRAAGALGLAVGVAIIVFGSLSVWRFTGTYDLDNVWRGLLTLQFYVAIALAAWTLVDRDPGHPSAWACIVGTAAAGLVVAASQWLSGTPAALDRRLPDGFAPFGVAVAAASAVLLIPDHRTLRLARRFWFAAPLALGVAALVAPWLVETVRVGTPISERLWAAAWVTAAALGLLGLTAWILARLRQPQEPQRGQGTAATWPPAPR